MTKISSDHRSSRQEMGHLTSKFFKNPKKRIKRAPAKKVRFAIDEVTRVEPQSGIITLYLQKEDDIIVRAIDDNIREMGIKEEIEEELDEEDESDSDGDNSMAGT